MQQFTLTTKDRAELTEQIKKYQLSFPKCLHFHYFTYGDEELKFERVRQGRWKNADHDLTIRLPKPL